MSKPQKVLIHVLGWAFFFSFPAIFGIISGEPTHRWMRGFYFQLVFKSLAIALFYWNASWLMPRFFKKGKYGIYSLIIIASITTMILLDVVYMKVFGTRMPPLFRIIVPGIFSGMLVVSASISYRTIAERIRTDQLLRETENERLKSELSFLRTQVNPHFLFNVLNSLVALSRKKSDKMEPALIRLSGLMRYLLREDDSSNVLLKEEIAYLKNYIDLQMLRFGDWIRLESHLPDDPADVKIEPMLLIPFVENAFKHGTGMTEEPWIYLSLKVEGQQLNFTVKNKVSAVGVAELESSGIGLKNVRRRLELLYPDQFELITGTKDDLYEVILKLKLA